MSHIRTNRHGGARIWEKDAEAKLRVDYLAVIHLGHREPHPHERHGGASNLTSLPSYIRASISHIRTNRHGGARVWEKDAEAKHEVDYLAVIHQGRREPHLHERHRGARRLEKKDTA